ncbi:MAG TPA: hypothetical protein VMB03_19055 [Bryobacteraceae bacterium]|nr:hypothetical protein [Bryobacteraceae bacterium]
MTETRKRGDYCHRCLEPAPPKGARCPKCGEPIHRAGRLRKLLAGIALIMVLAVVAISIRMMQTSGAPSAATGQPSDQTKPDKAPAPEVKPALGQ